MIDFEIQADHLDTLSKALLEALEELSIGCRVMKWPPFPPMTLSPPKGSRTVTGAV